MYTNENLFLIPFPIFTTCCLGLGMVFFLCFYVYSANLFQLLLVYEGTKPTAEGTGMNSRGYGAQTTHAMCHLGLGMFFFLMFLVYPANLYLF